MPLLQGHGLLLEDAGVLVEGHLPVGGGVVQLAGVLVPVHLGLGTVQGPGE